MYFYVVMGMRRLFWPRIVIVEEGPVAPTTLIRICEVEFML